MGFPKLDVSGLTPLGLDKSSDLGLLQSAMRTFDEALACGHYEFAQTLLSLLTKTFPRIIFSEEAEKLQMVLTTVNFKGLSTLETLQQEYKYKPLPRVNNEGLNTLERVQQEYKYKLPTRVKNEGLNTLERVQQEYKYKLPTRVKTEDLSTLEPVQQEYKYKLPTRVKTEGLNALETASSAEIATSNTDSSLGTQLLGRVAFLVLAIIVILLVSIAILD